MVTLVGSTINEELEIVARALHTEFDRQQSVISSAITTSVASINEELQKFRNEIYLALSLAPELLIAPSQSGAGS